MLDTLHQGNYSRMALGGDATGRDIVLAGFLSGFTHELGPVLLQLPHADPAVILAQACYMWMESDLVAAIELLAQIPEASSWREPADRLAGFMSRDVNVLSLSGSPGGAQSGSRLYDLRKDPGPGLQLILAGFGPDDDCSLANDRPLLEALQHLPAAHRRPDLVLNILEDTYLPPDFEALDAFKVAALPDMHHQVLRHSGYYQRHDLLLAHSAEQHEIASAIFPARHVVLTPFADLVFEDGEATDVDIEKDIDFSYGGSILWSAASPKQRQFWPIVNSDLRKSIIIYQGRFGKEKYKYIKKKSRMTGSFFGFRGFVTQPRIFEYIGNRSGIVMEGGDFFRLVLAPFDISVMSVAEFCGFGGGPVRPVHSASEAVPTELYTFTGLHTGRDEYRRLARRFGRVPGSTPRSGRDALRATIGLLLFHRAVLPAQSGAATISVEHSWTPNLGAVGHNVRGYLRRELDRRLARLETPADYNSAAIICRTLLSARPSETAGDSSPSPQGAAVEEISAIEPAMSDLRLRLSAAAVERFPDISLFLFRFLEAKLGAQTFPAIPEVHRPPLVSFFETQIAAETARYRAATPQPLLDLGPIELDNALGIDSLADLYMRCYAAQGARQAEAALSQELRRRTLAYLYFLRAELQRTSHQPNAAIASYWRSLQWSHVWQKAYAPLLYLIRYWDLRVVEGVVEPTELLKKALDVVRDRPELIRPVGPDLIILCDRMAEARLGHELADLWFRWIYRVVSSDGPIVSDSGVQKISAKPEYWPHWLTDRLRNGGDEGLKTVQGLVDYSRLDTVLREALEPKPSGRVPDV